jgi:hypothetical protein
MRSYILRTFPIVNQNTFWIAAWRRLYKEVETCRCDLLIMFYIIKVVLDWKLVYIFVTYKQKLLFHHQHNILPWLRLLLPSLLRSNTLSTVLPMTYSSLQICMKWLQTHHCKQHLLSSILDNFLFDKWTAPSHNGARLHLVPQLLSLLHWPFSQSTRLHFSQLAQGATLLTALHWILKPTDCLFPLTINVDQPGICKRQLCSIGWY